MPTKIFYRLLVDITMLLLTTLLMAYTLAGNQLHELLGVLFFVLFSLHQSLNLKWFQCLLNGKYAPRRLVSTVINALLYIVLLLLMVSGIMISQSVMPYLNFGSIVVGRTIHTLASHWYLLLMAIHLGLHLEIILAAINRVTGQINMGKSGKILAKAFGILVPLWGIVSFVKRGIGEKLMLLPCWGNKQQLQKGTGIDIMKKIFILFGRTYEKSLQYTTGEAKNNLPFLE